MEVRAYFANKDAYTQYHVAEAKNGAALPDHIYMDAMGFGMGCCCLQLTFQSCNVTEARRLYDAFVPLGPIMVKSNYKFHLLFAFHTDKFALRSAGIDSRQPLVERIYRRCRLQMERHCR